MKDLVPRTEINSPPLRWPLPRVTKVIHGKDGEARVMDVSTTNGLFTIPCLLLELTDEASQGCRHVPEFGLDSKKDSTDEK